MDALKMIAADSIKENRPQFEIGDTVRVHVNIREGERERVQMFEGTVIAKRGSGVSETFTVRRVSYGVGVERVFPVNSPNVKGVDVVRNGKIRKSLDFLIQINRSLCYKVTTHIVTGERKAISYKIHNY